MSETTTSTNPPIPATVSPSVSSSDEPKKTEILVEQSEEEQVVNPSQETNDGETVNAICFTMSAKKWKLLKTLGLILLVLAIAVMFLLFVRSGPLSF